jgi:hypothetical protein
MLTAAVALAAAALKVTVELPEGMEQAGRLAAPVGEVVREQLRVTVPAYAVVVLTVSVELAVPPGEMAAGAVAERV